LNPGSEARNKIKIQIRDHVSENLEAIFGLKTLKFFDGIRTRYPNLFEPESGNRDEKNSGPGSGINP
jgi:hypothetical protein